MTCDEFREIFEPAAIKCLGMSRTEFNKHRTSNIISFAKVIGQLNMLETYRISPPSFDKPMDPDLRNLLSAFAGPHGKAVFRAWQIKHGAKA